MAKDPNSLLATAACYDCYLSQLRLMVLALWKKYLQSKAPNVANDPQSLITSAGCYACYTPNEQMLLQLGLLKQVVLALNPSAVTDGNTLLDQAKCYDCAGGPGLWALYQLALLSQIAGP